MRAHGIRAEIIAPVVMFLCVTRGSRLVIYRLQWLGLTRLYLSWLRGCRLATWLDSTQLDSQFTELHSTPLNYLHLSPVHLIRHHSTRHHSISLHSIPFHSPPFHSTPLHSTPLHSIHTWPDSERGRERTHSAACYRIHVFTICAWVLHVVRLYLPPVGGKYKHSFTSSIQSDLYHNNGKGTLPLHAQSY